MKTNNVCFNLYFIDLLFCFIVIAFMDIQPVNKGHVLIVPKFHCSNMCDVPSDAAQQMFPLAQKINQALRNAKDEIKCEGINLFLADGEAAGQEGLIFLLAAILLIFNSFSHALARVSTLQE